MFGLYSCIDTKTGDHPGVIAFHFTKMLTLLDKAKNVSPLFIPERKIRMDKPLSSSLENYLEVIFHLVQEKHTARVKDIAQRMKVHNSSVTNALQSLSRRGLINYAPYDFVTLTDKGNTTAQQIVARHELLQDFLETILQIPFEEAEKAACEWEHAFSQPIYERFLSFLDFMRRCPRMRIQWDEQHHFFSCTGGPFPECATCEVSSRECLYGRGENDEK